MKAKLAVGIEAGPGPHVAVALGATLR